MYRETRANFAKTLISPASLCFTISPIDADQIPNGYCKSIKVSVVPNEQANTDISWMVVASTNDDALVTSDYITGQATARGGGTVWLNLKRPVKSSAEEPNRPDGEVFFHLLMPGGSPADPTEVNLVGECWGRFVNLSAL